MRRHRGKYADGNLERVIVPKGWVQPHAPNEERLLSMKGNTGVTDAEWYRRQERAGVSHSVDTLYPHEIVFLERFIPLGNQADWIPKSKTGESTNDFHWINRGVEAELKSLSGFKYSSAANRIADAVDSAVPHGVVKDIFVLDYGDSSVPEKLIYQLGLYNQRRTSSHIKELWLMDGDGLHEITLK